MGVIQRNIMIQRRVNHPVEIIFGRNRQAIGRVDAVSGSPCLVLNAVYGIVVINPRGGFQHQVGR